MKSHEIRRSRRQFLRRLGLGGASLAIPLSGIACADQAGIVDPGSVEEPPLPPPGAPPELRFSRPEGVAVEQYEVAEQRLSVVTSAGPIADPWVHFSSSDESVAIVSPRGIVFGRRPGTARISVSAEGLTGQFDVVVHAPQLVRHAAGPNDIVVQAFTSEAIIAALQDAARRGPGTVVFLPSGNYDITSRIDIPASDIVLRGAGRRSTWLVMSEALARQGTVETIRVSSVHRILIEELGFRYAVDDPGMDYGYPHQIAIAGSTETRIHRCAFEAGYNANWHVFIGMAVGGGYPSYRCGVVECQADASRGHGVEINNSDECYVERCVITRSVANGIEPYHRSEPFLRGTRLRDNVIIDSETACISLHSDFGSDVSGNVLRGGGGNGLVLSFGEAGPGVASRNGVCELNDIRGAGRITPHQSAGIMVGSAEGWTIRRNVVRDNRYHGILLGGANHTLGGNDVGHNESVGLYVSGVGHRILQNDFSDNVAPPAASGSMPAVLSDALDVEFRENRAEDTRSLKQHREHYYIRGSNVRFIQNRGQAATTTTGVAARLEASNAVVLGNEDVPNSGE